MPTQSTSTPVLDRDANLSLDTLYRLWGELGDVPVFPEAIGQFEAESLEEPFLHFQPGTPREEVWRWFEAQHPKFIVGEVMQGIRHLH